MTSRDILIQVHARFLCLLFHSELNLDLAISLSWGLWVGCDGGDWRGVLWDRREELDEDLMWKKWEKRPTVSFAIFPLHLFFNTLSFSYIGAHFQPYDRTFLLFLTSTYVWGYLRIWHRKVCEGCGWHTCHWGQAETKVKAKAETHV